MKISLEASPNLPEWHVSFAQKFDWLSGCTSNSRNSDLTVKLCSADQDSVPALSVSTSNVFRNTF